MCCDHPDMYFWTPGDDNISLMGSSRCHFENEANLGDMCHIVGNLSKYVPLVNSKEEPSTSVAKVIQCCFFGHGLDDF